MSHKMIDSISGSNNIAKFVIMTQEEGLCMILQPNPYAIY